MKKKNTFEKLARFLLIGSFLSFLLATLLSGFPIIVFLWNITFPTTTEKLSQVLSAPIQDTNTVYEAENEQKIPDQDLTLPTTPSVIIRKIGVNTQIHEEPLETFDVALEKGVWRVPNFGTPVERSKPTILVAHRFGFVSWEQSFREKNSFYNLPKLDVGDEVEIIWDQRKFVYEIYEKEEAKDISHYSADLILYTCRFFNSDIRIFRYARLKQNGIMN